MHYRSVCCAIAVEAYAAQVLDKRTDPVIGLVEQECGGQWKDRDSDVGLMLISCVLLLNSLAVSFGFKYLPL
ncbi:MAG: hypothetical protein F6K09_01975 [Merismopedia sp. SIO2A8]|nr:hypothetical protein [Merismopedia sp. SIO2A8]